jgi:hypothetical protein
MKKFKRYGLGILLLLSIIMPLQEAMAWVAARGGYGRRGFVAAGPGYHGYDHGCYGCGAAAGLAVGAITGAAIANARKPDTVYVDQPVVVQQPAVIVQQPAPATQTNYPLGTQFAELPPGSRSMVVNGVNYYQDGPVWYKPFFGSSGVYYEVVAAP